MTSRERVTAALAGVTVDRAPSVSFLPGVAADAGIDGEFRLTHVKNPFGVALEQGVRLSDLFDHDPDASDREVRRAADETRRCIAAAGDVDGIAYTIHGACELWTSPMGYGGWLLETDRELIKSASKPVFAFVVGRDAYLDVLSDLPCAVFAWDSEASSADVDEMRRMCRAKIATNRQGADFILETGGHDVIQLLEAGATTPAR
ncbi:MAG: hypothetical protein ACK4XJ_11275 [Fimbriimonadaceae bacterium]